MPSYEFSVCIRKSMSRKTTREKVEEETEEQEREHEPKEKVNYLDTKEDNRIRSK